MLELVGDEDEITITSEFLREDILLRLKAGGNRYTEENMKAVEKIITDKYFLPISYPTPKIKVTLDFIK